MAAPMSVFAGARVRRLGKSTIHNVNGSRNQRQLENKNSAFDCLAKIFNRANSRENLNSRSQSSGREVPVPTNSCTSPHCPFLPEVVCNVSGQIRVGNPARD